MSYLPSGRYQPLHARSSHSATAHSNVDHAFEVGHPESGDELASDGEWRRIPYRGLARWTGVVVAALGTIAALYWSTIGWKAYRVAARPHKEHSASKADIKAGEKVVQPYFGPESKGALVEDADLLVTIWYREGVSPPGRVPEYAENNKEWEWYRPSHGQSRSYSGVEEYGPMGRDYKNNETSWEQVLAFPTHLGSVSTKKQVTHKVQLPGRIV